MECINKVQLRGWVGAVREVTDGSARIYQFSIITDLCHHESGGAMVVETAWMNVTAFTSGGERWEWLKNGAAVEIEGRLRTFTHVGKDGASRCEVQVVASIVKPVAEEGE